MIVAYHRPQTLAEALSLLANHELPHVPLAGGTSFQQTGGDDLAVVDLQALGLNTYQLQGKSLQLGATLTLQALSERLKESPSGAAGPVQALLSVIEAEGNLHLRQVATVAGTLVSAGGRSPFACALLALDAQLSLLPVDGSAVETLALGELLPLRRERLAQRLITQVTLPMNARLNYAAVARTPADQPLVCVASAQWPSGRTRVALGGFGTAPQLAFDGPEAAGADLAARAAFSQAGDAWASADYRQDMAAVLTRRCLMVAA
jgi:CO/xanthine dehydrogenase FAD-binding subunit